MPPYRTAWTAISSRRPITRRSRCLPTWPWRTSMLPYSQRVAITLFDSNIKWNNLLSVKQPLLVHVFIINYCRRNLNKFSKKRIPYNVCLFQIQRGRSLHYMALLLILQWIVSWGLRLPIYSNHKHCKIHTNYLHILNAVILTDLYLVLNLQCRTVLSVPVCSVPDCVICDGSKCSCLSPVEYTRVEDRIIPSRARLSMPSCLEIRLSRSSLSSQGQTQWYRHNFV